MAISSIIRRLRKDPKMRKAIDHPSLAFLVAQACIDARLDAGMTQERLAKKMRTHQSAIARLENGTRLPSLRFLESMAKTLDMTLLPPSFTRMGNGKQVKIEYLTED